ncbi:MAG: hypothetical protein HY080_15155 [Gammaproteobacteria bacterium]|nr:hypothetical protein [Gammaproteobacteria bacterium]
MTVRIAQGITQWQARPLQALYPIIYFDALVIKSCRDQ